MGSKVMNEAVLTSFENEHQGADPQASFTTSIALDATVQEYFLNLHLQKVPSF